MAPSSKSQFLSSLCSGSVMADTIHCAVKWRRGGSQLRMWADFYILIVYGVKVYWGHSRSCGYSNPIVPTATKSLQPSCDLAEMLDGWPTSYGNSLPLPSQHQNILCFFFFFLMCVSFQNKVTAIICDHMKGRRF